MAFGNLPKKPNIVPIVTDQGRGVMHRRRAGRHQPAARAQQSRDLGRCVTLAARRRWDRGRGDHRRDNSLPNERLTANVHEAIDGAPAPVRWLVFDADALSQVDATGAHALKQLIGSLQHQGVTFLIARLKGPMQRVFCNVGLLDLVGERHIYPTVRAAVQAARTDHEGG